MTHKFKALGLALAAVFALSAVASSVASAAEQGELTSTGPLTLVGEETLKGSNFLEGYGLKFSCPGSTYTGHKYNVTPHTLIPSGSTTVTLTPHYNQAKHNCRISPGNFPATIEMNHCDLVIHLENTTPAGNKEGTYGVSVDIICPTGKEITIKAWTTEADETKPTEPMCVVHFPEQKGLKGVHATDSGNGNLLLRGLIEGIKVKKTQTTHTLLCPSKPEEPKGKYNIEATISGRDALGDATAISISEA
jgi:hypothetical protein